MPYTYEELQTFYRDYIQSINSGEYRRTLARFIHDQPEYNGKRLSLDEYQANIDAAFEHLQDARFEVELLVIDWEQQCIAARLAIRGTLIKPFLGRTGVCQPVLIREHVFYLLREGKVAEVRTLVVPE